MTTRITHSLATIQAEFDLLTTERDTLKARVLELEAMEMVGRVQSGEAWENRAQWLGAGRGGQDADILASVLGSMTNANGYQMCVALELMIRIKEAQADGFGGSGIVGPYHVDGLMTSGFLTFEERVNGATDKQLTLKVSKLR